jgi:hypothetical protein
MLLTSTAALADRLPTTQARAQRSSAMAKPEQCDYANKRTEPLADMLSDTAANTQSRAISVG